MKTPEDTHGIGRKPKLTASRLDFALASTGLCNITHNSFYMAGVASDHSAFFIRFFSTKK